MVKRILQSIHVYCTSIFEILVRTCDRIGQICNRFLWMSMEEKKRIALVNWSKVCMPKSQGGLGIRRLQLFNMALWEK